MITNKDRVVALLDGDIIAVRAAAVNDGGDPDDIDGVVEEWYAFISQLKEEYGRV